MPKASSGIGKGKGRAKGKITPATLAYKEFTAEPLPPLTPGDTYDYGKDGSVETKWFEENTNFREILSTISSSDEDALHQFTIGHFMDGQQYRGFSSMSVYDKQMVRRYDSMLDRSVISANVKLTRSATPELLLGGGVKTTTLTELQTMKGRVITSKANLSTAAAKVGLSIGDPSKQIEYKIHIPAGSKGAGMYIGVHGIHAWGERQREFMLNRDTKWQVGDTRYDKKRGVYEVDLYFVTRIPHDYS